MKSKRIVSSSRVWLTDWRGYVKMKMKRFHRERKKKKKNRKRNGKIERLYAIGDEPISPLWSFINFLSWVVCANGRARSCEQLSFADIIYDALCTYSAFQKTTTTKKIINGVVYQFCSRTETGGLTQYGYGNHIYCFRCNRMVRVVHSFPYFINDTDVGNDDITRQLFLVF